MFDVIQPTTFITHYSLLSKDIIKYLSGNNKIECVLNVTGAEQQHIDMIDEIVATNKIQCPFIFTNQPLKLNSLLQRSVKLISIMHGADIFLPNQNIEAPEYSIDLGVISNYSLKDRFKSLVKKHDTYHYISSDEKLADEVDIISPALHLYKLYNKYKKIVITQESMHVPQSIFDAIFYGNEVYYNPKYDSQKERMDTVVKHILKSRQSMVCGFNEIMSNDIDFKRIKNLVVSHHTCLSRVKRLLSKLNCSEANLKLDSSIQELVNDHSNS